jgi:hypothetical protein
LHQEAVVPDDPEESAVDQIDPTEFAQLREELRQTRIDNAMLQAGVDLDSPTGKMFRKAWDGDADADAIKAGAAEIPGALRSVPEPPAPDIQGEAREEGEADQFGERSAFASGDAAGAEDPDPKVTAIDELHADIDGGARVEDAVGATMRKLVAAANAGDTRVMVPQS